MIDLWPSTGATARRAPARSSVRAYGGAYGNPGPDLRQPRSGGLRQPRSGLRPPSTSRLDRAEKLPLYARAGVRHAWLVDPLARTLEVLHLERERWTIAATWADTARVRAERFDAIELDLAILWMDVEPAPAAP